jgi:CxxC-x17-CxxC domain-containing protein
MEQHRDEHITCAECGTTFVFTAAEASSFASKRLEPPKRCFECRKARRAQRGGGHRQDAPPRHHSADDVNGYRAPMADPAWSRSGREGEYRAPGFRDGRGADDRRGNARGRGEYRAPAFQNERAAPRNSEYRAPAFQNERAAPRNSEYRAPAYRDDRGPRSNDSRGNEYRAPAYRDDRGPSNSEHRAPAFDGNRAGPQGRGARNGPEGGFPPGRDRGRGDRRDAPRGARPAPDRGPRSGGRDRAPRSDHGPSGAQDRAPSSHDRGSKRQAERPSYPITCAQCGVASDVPFKPQEGREILCRDCYRARKESAA